MSTVFYDKEDLICPEFNLTRTEKNNEKQNTKFATKTMNLTNCKYN